MSFYQLEYSIHAIYQLEYSMMQLVYDIGRFLFYYAFFLLLIVMKIEPACLLCRESAIIVNWV